MTSRSRGAIGWPLFPVPDSTGTLRWPQDEERSVADQIRILLSTRPGEQLGWSTLGAGLDRFLHEPDSAMTRRRLRDAISEQLVAWEPRIEIDDVEIDAPDSPTQLEVMITYRLLRTGVPGRVAFRLGLDGGTP